MAAAGISPLATAAAPGAKMRAAVEEDISGRRSIASPAIKRFTSTRRMRLPSGAIVAPGNSFMFRRYSPKLLITISSLRRTSSTTMPTWRAATFTSTSR